VLTLLRDAESEDFVRRAGERNDRLVLLPRVREGTQMLFASMFLFLAHFAREALAEIARPGAAA
jgi:hypothetical protein